MGRFALSLFDKHNGAGFSEFLDLRKLGQWPQIKRWFLKVAGKNYQDLDRLLAWIEEADDSVCTTIPIKIAQEFLGRHSMSAIVRCPVCLEACPAEDGSKCLACTGTTPHIS